MAVNLAENWKSAVSLPETGRLEKPRITGLTMVIDKGLGLIETSELMQVASDHIDFVKMAFGTSVLYPTDLLQRKIELIRSYGVDVYPGGTLFEVSAFQSRTDWFFERAKELGFTYIEISEGTITLPHGHRILFIRKAIDKGFGVITEVGKKDKTCPLEPREAAFQISRDISEGAYKVIIEGRDSGKGVGIYDQHGAVREDLLEELVDAVGDANDLIFEAPQVSQQQHLLLRFGCNVNLGNVQPHDVITLETTRLGLRGDTLKRYLNQLNQSPDSSGAGSNGGNGPGPALQSS